MSSGSDRDRDSPTILGRIVDALPLPSVGEIEAGAAMTFRPAYSVIDRLKTIHRAPLRNLRHSIWWIRKTFFTKKRSPTPALLVDMTKAEVVRTFGRHYFEPGWELSYNYLGEVLNVRRIQWVDHEQYNWWQVHIRGYLHDDGGIELTAHYETEPSEHPDAHIDLYGLDIDHGMDVIQGILDSEEVDFQYLQPDELLSRSTSRDSSGVV